MSGFVPGVAAADEGHTHGSHGSTAAERLQEGVAILESRKIYAQNCAGCHGERGRGNAETRVDFSDPQALVEMTRERMLAVLAEGHGVPAGGFGEAEREAVVGYVRNFLMLPAPDADTEIGRAIYARSCSVCHGDRGDAASWAKNSLNPAPAAFTTHSQDQLSRKEMIDTVTFGEDGTAMMPFATQLSREEIAATVDYIRAAFMPETGGTGMPGHDHGSHGDHGNHGAKEPEGHAGHGSEGHSTETHAAARPGHEGHNHGTGSTEGAGFPDGLRGDVVWGEAFYNANCAECHGKEGNGEGPRAYFMIIKPENFLSREARAELNRPELFEHIAKGVNGTTMPAWEKVLTDQQIANVGEYVYRSFLHPEESADGAPAPGWRPAGASEGGAKKN